MAEPAASGEVGSLKESDRHLEAMQELTAAMAESGSTFRDRVEPVLAVGREYLGLPNGYVTTVTGSQHVVIATSEADEALAVGHTTPLSETYCRHTLNGDTPYVVTDTGELAGEDPAYETLPMQAYVGAPLDPDGNDPGTVCFVNNNDPIAEFSEWQHTLLEHITQWVESELERESQTQQIQESKRLLEATFNSPETYISFLNPDGTLIKANPAALELIDVNNDQVAGQYIWETPWWTASETMAQRCRDAVERAANGEIVQFEGEHTGMAGKQISTFVTVRPVLLDSGVEKLIIEGTDVTDLKRRENQIEFFNSVLRHDILNGMTVIEGRSKLLSESLDGDEQAHAETILDWSRNVSSLTQKVRHILNVIVREESPETEPTEIKPILTESIERITSADEGCTPQVDIHDDVSVMAGTLLSDVVENILMNAIEHAGPAPRIDVSTELTESTVQLSIADDGPGIPFEEKQSIFERGKHSGQSQGTGFGLYFVSGMVNSYGGSVWVEESDVGGSKFVIELPRA